MLPGDYKYLTIPEFFVISIVDLKKQKKETLKNTSNRINKYLTFCAERAPKIKSKGEWFRLLRFLSLLYFWQVFLAFCFSLADIL